MESIHEIVSIIVFGMALFILPGYATLTLFRCWRELDLIEMLCAAAGLSVAVIALILHICTYLGVRMGPGAAMLFLLIAGGMCLWDWWNRFRRWRKLKRQPTDLAGILLGIVFFFALWARIAMVKDIVYPLWTDSYHHTMITQLIVDGGIVPSSYRPYAPIDHFTYHFGFHAVSAWFHWLSGIPVPRSVVLVGQIFNALVVPTTYLLTRRLFQSQSAGVVAAVVVGLLSPMPALFVNWGRYTQLSGQILLPVLMVLTLLAFNPRTARRGLWLLAGIGAAGLFLVHIRIFLFYAVFAGLLFLRELLKNRHRLDLVRPILVNSLAMLGVMLVCDSLWLWRYLDGFGAMLIREISSGYHAQDYGSYFTIPIQEWLHSGMSAEFWIISAIGAVWGLMKKEESVWLIIVWVLCLLAAANLYLARIPPLFSNLIVMIYVYLPVAVLIGYLASQLIDLGARLACKYLQITKLPNWIAVAGLVLIGVVGVRLTTGLIRPQDGFVRPADAEAMQWISENVPDNALFYVKTHFWTPKVAHGLDAGYWIPLLAHRQTILPPQTYGSDGSAEYAGFINQRAYELALNGKTPDQVWQAIMKYGITHIYIGSRQTDLQPSVFLSYPTHLRVIYSRGGVWILEVVR